MKLAVVVLYHPGEDLTGNINSSPQVDKLLLWETPRARKNNCLCRKSVIPERLEGIGRDVSGIGIALNDAVDYPSKNGFTHLLTHRHGEFRRYMTAVRGYGEDEQTIFSVNYFIKSQQSSLYPVVDTVDKVSSAMTSGTIYPVATCLRNWVLSWKTCLISL